MKYAAIIFDLDGTLFDTAEGIVSSVVFMINSLNLPDIPDDIIRSFVGPRIQDSLERVYGLGGEKLDAAARVFRDKYKDGDVLKASLYTGALGVLRKLKSDGYSLAVATNKRQDFVGALLKKYALENYFDSVHGTDFYGILKKEDLIKNCLSDLGIDSSETILIGDSSYDAAAAEKTNVSFIAALYGYEFRTENDLVDRPHIGFIKDIGDLPAVLKFLEK